MTLTCNFRLGYECFQHSTILRLKRLTGSELAVQQVFTMLLAAVGKKTH